MTSLPRGEWSCPRTKSFCRPTPPVCYPRSRSPIPTLRPVHFMRAQLEIRQAEALKKSVPSLSLFVLFVHFTDTRSDALEALAVRGQQDLPEGRGAKAALERAGERWPRSSPAGA